MMEVPRLDASLGTARVRTRDDRLFVSTGQVARSWQWTGAGFATREVRELTANRRWQDTAGRCDWQLPQGGEPSAGRLLSLAVDAACDEGFTSEHLCLTAELLYPQDGLLLRWIVWVYPGAPGVRTQLAARLAGSRPARQAGTGPKAAPDARVDRVPGGTAAVRRFFGYYNATQQRNDTHLDLLKEAVNAYPLRGREWCDWASVACLEAAAGGIALVKESHKCVNQSGHATGGFVCDAASGLACTGWGLLPNELSDAEFTKGWATWCLVWNGAEFERQTAFKTFERFRFPVDPARDSSLQANTWGNGDCGEASRRAAAEASVLRELEICAELGIDTLQIDDGWQVPPGHASWQPGEGGWQPHPAGYPQGWSRVRRRAAELGVNLGLWAAAQHITLRELQASREAGGFRQYKLDYAHLKSRRDIDELMGKVRAFISWSGHRVRVNWDVTENAPRCGYFFGREYGSLYLENRKPAYPPGVVYRPHTVLRDLWQAARYLDLRQIQGTIQNVDLVDRARSDAHLHSQAYAVAIALMSLPLFFLETKLYSAAAKAQIKPLLNAYRQHREALSRGLVYPIGSQPNNHSWTGFQCRCAGERRGYLLVFRELHNACARHSVRLYGLPPGRIRLTDLLDGSRRDVMLREHGRIPLRIPQAPGFLFLGYDGAEQKQEAARARREA